MSLKAEEALGAAIDYVNKTIQGEGALKGQDGFSPVITENADNTEDIYKLDITTADRSITTPNLKGEKGDKGEQGPQGEQGIQGEKGEQGEKGADGENAMQADWSETDNTSMAYIKNKPNIPEGVTVDKSLDGASGNAVANSAVTAAIDDLQSSLDEKQNTLTFDDAPKTGSANPVKSSGIYTALDKKLDNSGFGANAVMVTDSSGKVSVSAVTSTELGYLDGVTSNVQAQLDTKAPKSHASTATTYGAGTANNYGHVKLSDAVNSTSGTGSAVAATPYAVKQAYDLANTANTAAANAQDDIDSVNDVISKIPIEKAVYSSTTSNVPSGYTAPTSTSDFPAPTDGIDIELMRGIYNISSVMSNSTAGVYRYVGQGACDITANLPSDSQYKSMTTVKVGATLSDYALNFTERTHCRFENITFVVDKTSNLGYGLLKTTSAGTCVEFINCAFVFNTSRLFYFNNCNARFTNCDFYCTTPISQECAHIIEQYNSGRVIISNCRVNNYGDVSKCYLNNMTYYGSYGLSNSTLYKVNPVRIDTSAPVGEKVRIVGNIIEAAHIGLDTTETPATVGDSCLTIANNNITGSAQMYIAMPTVSCTLCNNSFASGTPVGIYCCGQYTTISANSGGEVIVHNYRGNTTVTGNSFVSYTQAVSAGNILKTGNMPTT